MNEKPGGIVVVAGLLISKIDGEESDGDGRGACVDSGVKVTVLVILLMDCFERYLNKFC